MNGEQFRFLLRWIHIAVAGVTGTFIYSPWTSYPLFQTGMKWVVFPLLVVTGIMMWQQGKIMQFFSTSK